MIKTYDELCQYMATEIGTGYIDWPFYSGELGSDSLGGTDEKVYEILNGKYGILTMDSQEGTCESMYEPLDVLHEPGQFTPLYRLRKRYPDIYTNVVSKVQERQRSELSALVPETTAQRLKYICHDIGLWFSDDKSSQEHFVTTEISYLLQDLSILQFSDGRYRGLTTVDTENTIEGILNWDKVDKTSLKHNFDQLKMTSVVIVNPHFCSQTTVAEDLIRYMQLA